MKIDLSKLPEGTKWIAIDEDGSIWGFTDEPTLTYFEVVKNVREWHGDPTAKLGNVHD